MSGLGEAIRRVLEAKEISAAAIADRMARDRSRPTFYRLLTGEITHPRLDTFVRLCELLQVSPTELLELAGLWTFHRRSTNPVDVRLRKIAGEIWRLPEPAKRVAVSQTESLLPSWRLLARGGRRGRGRPSG